MNRVRKILYSLWGWMAWPKSVERRLFIHSDRLQHLYVSQEDGAADLQKQIDDLREVLARHTDRFAELRHLKNPPQEKSQ